MGSGGLCIVTRSSSPAFLAVSFMKVSLHASKLFTCFAESSYCDVELTQNILSSHGRVNHPALKMSELILNDPGA